MLQATNPELEPNQLRDFQLSFSGGMRLDVDPTRLESNEYTLLVNGRVREDVIEPITLPSQITEGIPNDETNFQGLKSAGSVLVLFAGGRAFARDFNLSDSQFNQIAALGLDANVDRIYAELVPASTVNSARIIASDDKYDDVSLEGTINGSPQAMVVQDGINQGWIILADGSARVTKNYDAWTVADREYLPKGRQMLYSDGILYVVSESGKEIYRSVTGRPVDFMVAITSTGDKLPTSAEGGAEALSHKVDFNEITCLGRINSEGFLATTKRHSYLVLPNTDRLIYGEPTFKTQFLFTTGALNNVSLCDILGDTALIDFSGIRSFNAVLQLRNEGKNSPFSKPVARLFKDIIQTHTAAITFDNYALFSVTTIYGAAVLIYDTLIQKFVALDIYPGVGLIKQFEEVKTDSERLLFFITTDNKLYQAFSGVTGRVRLYTREFCTNDPEKEHKVDFLKTVFIDVVENGIVNVTPIVDKKQGSVVNKVIKSNKPVQDELSEESQETAIDLETRTEVISTTYTQFEPIEFSIGGSDIPSRIQSIRLFIDGQDVTTSARRDGSMVIRSLLETTEVSYTPNPAWTEGSRHTAELRYEVRVPAGFTTHYKTNVPFTANERNIQIVIDYPDIPVNLNHRLELNEVIVEANGSLVRVIPILSRTTTNGVDVINAFDAQYSSGSTYNIRYSFTEIDIVTKSIRKEYSSSTVITVTSYIEDTTITQPNGVEIPYGQNTYDLVDNETFKFQSALQGWKTGFLIEWGINARLSHLSVVANSAVGATSLGSKAKSYPSNIR